MILFRFISAGRLLRLLPLLVIVGCSDGEQRPDVHPAQGRLFVNGRPAEGALISLHPGQGKDFDRRGSRPLARVREDGTFELSTYEEGDGAPAGEYAVSIVWFDNPDALDPSPDKLGGRFADPKTSKFRVTITDGENRLEPFEINGVRLPTRTSGARSAGPDPPM